MAAKKNIRRTEEQLIEELKARIELLEQRKATKRDPSLKSTVQIVRLIDKVSAEAADQENNLLRHVLADARTPLANFLHERGLSIEKTRRPKGPRPKLASRAPAA